MTLFLFFIGIVQCAIIWLLGRTGRQLVAKARLDREKARYEPDYIWPGCAMIIPVSGRHPVMDAALRSLLEQDYPDYAVCLVTAGEDDPAMEQIRSLMPFYPNLSYAVAGETVAGGQKNHNLLAGVASVGGDCDIYVFCDSTHIARPDFLRCLVAPIAEGKAPFSTGYHEVDPEDNGTVTLAYAQSVLAMRFLQAMTVFTQPWGGALAMSRQAFVKYEVADLWSKNVVDDCSLAWWLRERGVKVALCPGAVLLSPARGHELPVWRAWLERQILFLKFCLPGQWLGLGLFCALMIAPACWCAWSITLGILGLGGNTAPFLALCWGCLAAWAIDGWQPFLPRAVDNGKWLWAFLCACAMFSFVYVCTIWQHGIKWRNITYRVGQHGAVLEIRRDFDSAAAKK